MKYYKAIETLVTKYERLAADKYLTDYERQQVCYEFIDWLNDQRNACGNLDVDSVSSVEHEEWATFCDVSDVDPKKKVHRKYGFDALNYDNEEDW